MLIKHCFQDLLLWTNGVATDSDITHKRLETWSFKIRSGNQRTNVHDLQWKPESEVNDYVNLTKCVPACQVNYSKIANLHHPQHRQSQKDCQSRETTVVFCMVWVPLTSLGCRESGTWSLDLMFVGDNFISKWRSTGFIEDWCWGFRIWN